MEGRACLSCDRIASASHSSTFRRTVCDEPENTDSSSALLAPAVGNDKALEGLRPFALSCPPVIFLWGRKRIVFGGKQPFAARVCLARDVWGTPADERSGFALQRQGGDGGAHLLQRLQRRGRRGGAPQHGGGVAVGTLVCFSPRSFCSPKTRPNDESGSTVHVTKRTPPGVASTIGGRVVTRHQVI